MTDRVWRTHSEVLDTSMTPSMMSVDVGVEPVNVAVQPGGAFAYVVNNFSDSVSVVDTGLDTEVDGEIIVGDNARRHRVHARRREGVGHQTVRFRLDHRH